MRISIVILSPTSLISCKSRDVIQFSSKLEVIPQNENKHYKTRINNSRKNRTLKNSKNIFNNTFKE